MAAPAPESGPKRMSIKSTTSGMSAIDRFLHQRHSITRIFYRIGKRLSDDKVSGYTSLFPRKLLPPLGFYTEVDRYSQLKLKFAGDPLKLEALEEMWKEFEKFQIRKRFRWPPKLFFGDKIFWTTGYYPDYQKDHRPTRSRKGTPLTQGDDSSDDDLKNMVGTFMLTETTGDDINVKEWLRFRQARAKLKPQKEGNKDDNVPQEDPQEGRRKSRKSLNTDGRHHRKSRKSRSSFKMDPSPGNRETVIRLFGNDANDSKTGMGGNRDPAKERAEQERLAREKAAQERLAREKAEQERRAREKAEQERLARERAEQEKRAREKAEQERLAREKAEQERRAREKAEQERLAKEKADQEKAKKDDKVTFDRDETGSTGSKKGHRHRRESKNVTKMEETETVVEYTLIRDPNKKRKSRRN